MSKKASAFIAICVAVMMTGCKFDKTKTKIQYMPDMADSPTVKAGESYIVPPEGSVNREEMIYPDTLEEAEKTLKNPLPRSEENIEAGGVMFATYCAACHGKEGHGKHTLGPNWPTPPDIMTDDYTSRADGYWFYRITFGAAIMPGYGYAITPKERWQIIQYIKGKSQ